MIYLLDTNVCIRYLQGRSDSVVEQMQRTLASDIVVCSVVKAELFYGAARSQNPARSLAVQKRFLNQFISLPFDDKAAEIYGEVRTTLANTGRLIGPNDLLIAAIALANDATLVTHNIREFSRVPNLPFVDWETSDGP